MGHIPMAAVATSAQMEADGTMIFVVLLLLFRFDEIYHAELTSQ